MAANPSPPRGTFHGEVVGIFIASQEGGPTKGLNHVRAISGEGLEGDRYFSSREPDSDPSKRSEITLIEAEALEAAERDYDVKFEPGDSRRNLVTRAVALNHLVGRTFRAGDAVLEGVKLCEPCQYLEGLTRPGARKAFIHRGGLRARIVRSGAIRVGDSVLPDA